MDIARRSAINLLETNLKAIDGINIVRSSTIVEMLWLNMDKDYDQQRYTEKRPRNSNSIETVKLRDSINQPSQRFPFSTIFKAVWK